jgi:hypothetical protein
MMEEDVELLEREDDRIPPKSRWRRVWIGLVALIAIGSLVYLSGIHQYLFLHRTPAGALQSRLPSKVEAAKLVVPVAVHILTGEPGSGRTEEDAHRLVENANNIWSQANITFRIEDVRHIVVEIDDLVLFEADPHTYIQQSSSYDPAVINIYLTRTLQGVNGLAYRGTRAVSVADYTSTLDFRTLAHEFGHLLGLEHVGSSRQLMSTGATGVELTEQEITTAREVAVDSAR